MRVATKNDKEKLNIENKNHPSKELYETIKGLKINDKSYALFNIEKVYDRGRTRWNCYRLGTTQQQWELLLE